jgi:hypothetical protein
MYPLCECVWILAVEVKVAIHTASEHTISDLADVNPHVRVDVDWTKLQTLMDMSRDEVFVVQYWTCTKVLSSDACLLGLMPSSPLFERHDQSEIDVAMAVTCAAQFPYHEGIV